jgi:hypothetical protein
LDRGGIGRVPVPTIDGEFGTTSRTAPPPPPLDDPPPLVARSLSLTVTDLRVCDLRFCDSIMNEYLWLSVSFV